MFVQKFVKITTVIFDLSLSNIMKPIRILTLAILTALAAPSLALANTLDLDISKASSTNPYQVALVPFLGDNVVTGVINTNLNHTELKANSQNLPKISSSAEFVANQLAFSQQGYPFVVVGNITNAGNNKVNINFEVIEVNSGRVIGGRQSQLADNTANGLRYAGHVVSDRIYELLTGKPGDFSGRIAFVEETGDPRNKTSSLKVMDADGQNVVELFRVQGSIFSPNWSPDGNSIAYSVQRPNGLPVIYVQSADGGNQRLVTPYMGQNLGASFSPDGTTLLFSGSHEKNDPAIYQLHLASGSLKKITNMAGAENSPSYSPDGRSFVFTADGGSRTPQLYRYDFNTNQATRIASGAAAGPRFSKDGKKIAYVAGSTLVVMNLGGGIQSIAPTSTHESASFSPNSTRIAYASNNGGQGAITIRSLVTGQSFTKTATGRVREPSWSNGRKTGF